MTTAAIPTLGTSFLLTDVDDIIAYQLRHAAAVPKNATDRYVEETASIADILSYYGYDREAVRDPIVQALLRVYSRYFDPSAVTVQVTTETASASTARYNIVISVSVTVDGQTHGLRASYKLIDGQLVI